MRSATERFERDLEDLETRTESRRIFEETKRNMKLEHDDADVERKLEQDDTLEEEAHQRHESIQLAITLAESERLRRIGETEREQLENLSEELAERHANQRTAGQLVEEERRRRMLENPAGSPFAKPGDTSNYTEDQLDELNRKAASLLADHMAQEEKARRIHVSRMTCCHPVRGTGRPVVTLCSLLFLCLCACLVLSLGIVG